MNKEIEEEPIRANLTIKKISFKFLLAVLHCFILNKQLKINKLEITHNE
jgi:hypothetical protein